MTICNNDDVIGFYMWWMTEAKCRIIKRYYQYMYINSQNAYQLLITTIPALLERFMGYLECTGTIVAVHK
jgi:hypothetical protein